MDIDKYNGILVFKPENVFIKFLHVLGLFNGGIA
jgi:hypothetical protein